MAFAHLSDGMLVDVQQAALALGFSSDATMAALTSGIHPPYIGSVLVGGSPNARLLSATNDMNVTRNLVNGEVPFAKWLTNAALLASGRPEEKVFRAALATISVDALPGAASDVAQEPTTMEGELEVWIDEDDTLGALFLQQGATACRSVARLAVHRHFDGEPSRKAGGEPDLFLGTGWLLAPGLVITNHHVIAARQKGETAPSSEDFALQGAATSVQFDYYADGEPGTSVAASACLVSDASLDFALLRIPGTDRAPLRLLGQPLVKPAGKGLGARVNVLQHPEGDPMRLGFRNNFVVIGDAAKLSYLTDTAGGSSGSPVLDDAWQVAALHRGWRTIEGGPVRVWGKPISQENYGTPIGMILDHLAAGHPALRQEVDAAQQALP